jgi:hypothetical protein
MSAVTTRILRQIQLGDPDGGETEPTEADYARFEAGVIATYGRAAWNAYNGSNWAERSDSDDMLDGTI